MPVTPVGLLHSTMSPIRRLHQDLSTCWVRRRQGFNFFILILKGRKPCRLIQLIFGTSKIPTNSKTCPIGWSRLRETLLKMAAVAPRAMRIETENLDRLISERKRTLKRFVHYQNVATFTELKFAEPTVWRTLSVRFCMVIRDNLSHIKSYAYRSPHGSS